VAPLEPISDQFAKDDNLSTPPILVRIARTGYSTVAALVASRYSLLHHDVLGQSDAHKQLLQDWVLWQRGRGMSDKTITDRLTVIRRIPDAAGITPQGVDGFLTSTAWSRATRANYHGAIRAWCKWLIITGRRVDDPTLIATTPKVKKGRPRPVAEEHLAILLETRMYKRTRAMILVAAYAGPAGQRDRRHQGRRRRYRHQHYLGSRQGRQGTTDPAPPRCEGDRRGHAVPGVVVPHLHREHQTSGGRPDARQLRQLEYP
jgi:hypothetical protein